MKVTINVERRRLFRWEATLATSEADHDRIIGTAWTRRGAMRMGVLMTRMILDPAASIDHLNAAVHRDSGEERAR